MTGPAPMPTNLRILTGNLGKRPINDREPQPDSKIPSCPKHVTGEARKHYKRLSKMLHKNGLLTEIDGEMLAGGCIAWAAWKDAVAKLEITGPVVLSPKSKFPVLNPFFSVASTAWEQYRRVLCSFGMTPADRSRTIAANKQETKSKKQRGIAQFLT